MKKKYKGVCIKTYFNPKTFPEVAKDAEKAGKRRVGLQLYTKKEHGFADERVANTDGIAKFLKHCWQYWHEHESDRLQRIAELKQKKKELEEDIRKYGVDV